MRQTPGDRLTTPLIRENGKHRPATWEEALDRVAEGIPQRSRSPRAAHVRNVQLLKNN